MMWSNYYYDMNKPWTRGYGVMGGAKVDHKRYSVAYDRYVTSKMNKDFTTREIPVLGEDGLPTFEEDGTPIVQIITQDPLNEFIWKDEKGNNILTYSHEFTLNEKIDYALDYNIFGLDMNLVVWSEPNVDVPINYSRLIYTAFLSYFWNNQINQQTIDLHKLKLQAFFNARKLQLTGRYRAMSQYQKRNNTQNTKTNDGSKGTSTLYRQANSTVPENEVNVDVATTTLDYADDFTKWKKDVSNTDNSSSNNDTLNTKDNDLMFLLNAKSELQWLFDEAIQQELFMM